MTGDDYIVAKVNRDELLGPFYAKFEKRIEDIEMTVTELKTLYVTESQKLDREIRRFSKEFEEKFAELPMLSDVIESFQKILREKEKRMATIEKEIDDCYDSVIGMKTEISILKGKVASSIVP